MKRIAIFCDGTWMNSDHMHPTNVVRLAQAVVPSAPDGTKQVVHYVRGVGTGRGTGRLARLYDRWAGGVLGLGLMTNVEEAYRFLVFAYEPGDEIHIFGFSRGAFTARSLAGLIRASGVVSRRNVWMVPEAIARYRSGGPRTAPDDEESFKFRLRWSPDVTTSQKEETWRRELPGPIDPGARLQISYLGVWDTVGALGVPQHHAVLSRVGRRHSAFHNTALSRLVAAAHHAVAIDERRRTFPPTLWSNLSTLNDMAGRDGAGRDGGGPYRQLWFPGDHGSVGGGGDVVGLSSDALVWIAEGARQRGLVLDEARMEGHAAEVDHRASLRNASRPSRSFFDRLLRRRPQVRAGPRTADEVSPSVLLRFHEPAECLAERRPYRPPSLRALERTLAGLVPGSRAAGSRVAENGVRGSRQRAGSQDGGLQR